MNDLEIIETRYRPEPRRFRTEPTDVVETTEPRRSLHKDIENVYQHHLNLRAETKALARELGVELATMQHKHDKQMDELTKQIDALRSEFALFRYVSITIKGND